MSCVYSGPSMTRTIPWHYFARRCKTTAWTGKGTFILKIYIKLRMKLYKTQSKFVLREQCDYILSNVILSFVTKNNQGRENLELR